MSKETGIILLGIFVAALPFLGFPESWRVVMYVVGGLGIMLLGFFLRADHLHHASHSMTTSSLAAKRMSDVTAPQPLTESSPLE